jgi:glutamate N-acetyltransferase/amino-acid N-acetyltransferase
MTFVRLSGYDTFAEETMKAIEAGSILSPKGFRAGYARCGIKTAEGQPDVALIVSDVPASAAGVFTTNKFAAASVEWNRGILPAADLRAVVVNSGNANACTGDRGSKDTRTTAALVAQLLSCKPAQVAVASTGIIGHPLPMDRLSQGVRDAFAALSCEQAAARGAERAIMTTDTRPKACAVRAGPGGKQFSIGGMAKGSGMIAPNMATLLAFLTTDAQVAPGLLPRILKRAADRTFNRITVDGDSSTNDTVLLLANGASGAKVRPGSAARAFEDALIYVMGDLSKQIVRDGEGATKLIEVTVTGARSEAQAATAARAIANSLLVKCAIHGGDPNWGRILCAAGYSGVDLKPSKVKLQIGAVSVFKNGLPTEAHAASEVAGKEVSIRLDLGVGRGKATVWTCDLSKEYVAINAHYHT